jgi:hypothetical protein
MSNIKNINGGLPRTIERPLLIKIAGQQLLLLIFPKRVNGCGSEKYGFPLRPEEHRSTASSYKTKQMLGR